LIRLSASLQRGTLRLDEQPTFFPPAGAQPQRLLWASTGTKDPKAPDTLYIRALATPFTVNTIPEGTLKAVSDHVQIGPIMAADGGDCEAVLEQFAQHPLKVVNGTKDTVLGDRCRRVWLT
jgi:transaldolase